MWRDQRKIKYLHVPTVVRITHGFNVPLWPMSKRAKIFCEALVFFLICIKKNYINGNCHSRSRCSNCQGPHYFSICDPRGKSPKFKDPETQKSQSTVGKARQESYANISVLAPRHWSPPDSWSNRMYSPYSRRNQLSLWNSRSKTIKPFGLNTGNHQQCQVMQLCIDMIYHPCAGYLFSISRSALSRKTARVYPHFAGLTFADNCEEEVRSTDWHIGWRGPLLESFYLYSSPGVVQESQKSTVINTKLGWALFWSSSLPGIFVKHH